VVEVVVEVDVEVEVEVVVEVVVVPPQSSSTLRPTAYRSTCRASLAGWQPPVGELTTTETWSGILFKEQGAWAS
jgi:hypothetical protein